MKPAAPTNNQNIMWIALIALIVGLAIGAALFLRSPSPSPSSSESSNTPGSSSLGSKPGSTGGNSDTSGKVRCGIDVNDNGEQTTTCEDK